MTGLLCFACAVAFNPLGLTAMLPTQITFTHRNTLTESRMRRYGKISNPVQHRQHLHHRLASLPACPAPAAVSLYGQPHTQGLTSAVLGVQPCPECGPGLDATVFCSTLCCRQQNPSRALLLLIITPCRHAMFWVSLAQYFMLLWID